MHKRCHQNVVTKCPKERDTDVDSSLVSTAAVVSVILLVIVTFTVFDDHFGGPGYTFARVFGFLFVCLDSLSSEQSMVIAKVLR